MRRTSRLVCLLPLAVLLNRPLLNAQEPPSDYFLSTHSYAGPNCCSWAGFYRLTPMGRATSIVTGGGAGLAPFSQAVVEPATRSAFVSWGPRIHEIDIATFAVLRTVTTAHNMFGLTHHHATGIAATGQGTLLHMAPGTLQITTIGIVSSAFAVTLHGRDLWSGDYIAADTSLILASVDGQNVRRIGSGPMNIYAGSSGVVQSLTDGDLRVFTTSGVAQVDPRSGQQRPLVSSPTMTGAVVLETSLGGDVIRHVRWNGQAASLESLTPSGIVVATVPITPAVVGRPWAMCRAAVSLLSSRRITSPNRWTLRIDSPTDAGFAYVIALSATGFAPGVKVGSRTIALVPDALFALSIRGALGPLFTGGTGRIPASGVATATLDLGRFGTSLNGLRVWALAAILDPNAPDGFRRLTRPEVLVLD